jgi:cytochrome c biogenesis protein CcmG/thiol:disulfide interchange protein DsbE
MANNSVNPGQWVDEHLARLRAEREWQPDVERALARFYEQRSSTRRWPWMAAATAVCCGCLVAFPAPRAVAQRCVDACSVLFQKKIDVPGATRNSANGRQLAPDFTVKDSRGADFRLSDYRDKVVLLNFWATNCAPCRAEIPWFIEFDRTYRDKGFAVVGISMDDDGWPAIRPFMAEKKINYRIGLGNDAVAQLYGGLDAIPESLLIDRTGKIVATHVGLIPRSDWEKELSRALAEK